MADLFDRFAGSAGLLSGHTADSGDTWTVTTGDMALDGAGSLYSTAEYNTIVAASSWTPPGTDYEAAIVVGAFDPSAWAIGPGVRLTGSPGSQSCYLIVTQGSPYTIYISRYNAGSQTNLTSVVIGGSPAAGDVISLSAQTISGNVTVTAYVNGTQVAQTVDSSGSKLTSVGVAGILLDKYGASSSTDIIRALWAGAIGGPTETITPSTPSVVLSATQSFTAATAHTNEAFTWSATHGSISGTGATESYTAPGSGSTDSVTWTSVDLPTSTATATVALIPGYLALSGPTSGTTGLASTNFTVAATGLSASDTATCHSDSGGSFTTSPLSFSAGSGSHTFTYTAAADGVHSISITDSLGATISGSPVTYTSTTPTPTRRPGAMSAARRAKFIAGLPNAPRLDRPPPLAFTAPTPRSAKVANPAPPARPAISDAKPSKAKLDFPL
jgi:hypothetical protein